MKPSEVGFDGTIQVYNGNNNVAKIYLARAIHDSKGPDSWLTSWNPNMNGKITNTFIWWEKGNESELFYRNKEGKLFTVNFESVD